MAEEWIVNQIKERRAERGLTQQEVAQLVGVSRQSIISIEQGRYVPSLPLALKFAQVFQCAVDDLFRLVEATS